MIKKIARAVKHVILWFVWTVLFINLSRIIIYYIWKFNILSLKQWKMIKQYWDNNGVISGFSDISFFIALILVFVIWFIGMRKVNKIKYGQLLLKPIEYFANKEIKKYENIDTHVVIKNISVGEKISIEDVIKDRINQEKANSVKGAEELRKNVIEKIIQRKEQ
ncbi:MAG: hypothetical protein IJW75_00475 [Alphaproteobacteria bacterium]|nr:hypothetical protein [Alphaproteobacteria bacterium]